MGEGTEEKSGRMRRPPFFQTPLFCDILSRLDRLPRIYGVLHITPYIVSDTRLA